MFCGTFSKEIWYLSEGYQNSLYYQKPNSCFLVRKWEFLLQSHAIIYLVKLHFGADENECCFSLCSATALLSNDIVSLIHHKNYTVLEKSSVLSNHTWRLTKNIKIAYEGYASLVRNVFCKILICKPTNIHECPKTL